MAKKGNPRKKSKRNRNKKVLQELQVVSLKAVNAKEDVQKEETRVKVEENTTSIKITYDKNSAKCTIFNDNGEVICEEYANRLAMNFAENKATFTTKHSMLESYNIDTGNKIFSAIFHYDGEIEKI